MILDLETLGRLLDMWVVVNIRVPFGVLTIIRHLKGP